MEYVEIAPEDIPDPRPEVLRKIGEMPVAPIAFVSQPHLELAVLPGYSERRGGRGPHTMHVSLTYVLLRNPADRAAPENLAEMNDDTRVAFESAAVPAWLAELTEQMKYPQLWEAVRTTWHRDDGAHASLDAVLLDHVNHVLRNSFRTERGLDGMAGGVPPAPDVDRRAVQRPATLAVDGADLAAAMIDTDPHVFAIGAELPSGGLVTVVVPRDALELIRMEFETLEL